MEAWIHDDVDENFVTKKFSLGDLHEDIDYLIATMKQPNPAFGQYVDVDALNQKQQQLKSKITTNMTRTEASNTSVNSRRILITVALYCSHYLRSSLFLNPLFVIYHDRSNLNYK